MKFRPLPLVPDQNMINAAHTILESVPLDTPERRKRAVASVYEAMVSCAPSAPVSGISRRMHQTLEVIIEYIEQHGMSPTYAEIARQIGGGRPEVYRILVSLRKRGFVTFARQRRSIRVLVYPTRKG